MRILPAALLLASVAVLTPAGAAEPYADQPQAHLSWSMSFGPQSAGSGHSLALGYRTFGREFAPVKVLQLDVASLGSQARLLGLPFYDTRYVARQAEGGGGGGGAGLAFEWRYVWWAVSGIAVTAIAIDQASGDDESAPTGTGASP